MVKFGLGNCSNLSVCFSVFFSLYIVFFLKLLSFIFKLALLKHLTNKNELKTHFNGNHVFGVFNMF